MALAFPGQGGMLWEVMVRDAFLNALGDQSLRVRVLEKDPMTLDEALTLTCRMDAIARSPPEDDYDDRGRRRRQQDQGRPRLDWIGLCSVLRPRQHGIGYMGDGFYKSKDPTNSIKVLNEDLQNTKSKQRKQLRPGFSMHSYIAD